MQKFIYYICMMIVFYTISCHSMGNVSNLNTSYDMPNANLTFTQVGQTLAKNLIVPNQKVCLGQFTIATSYQEPLATSLQQEIEFEMSKQMQILERKRLQEILEQHRLENSNFFNQDQIERIGQFAQVDYIVLGNIQERTNDYEILAKLVNVKTAVIAKATKVYLAKEKVPPHLIQQMAQLELIESGYGKKSADKPELMGYFTQSYLSNSTGKQNQSQPLELQMRALKKVANEVSPLTNGDHLQPQDMYQIELSLNKPAYLYSLSLNGQGDIQPIFPNASAQDMKNPLQANQTYHLPGPNAKDWFVVKDQAGLGQIGILVSIQPIPDLEKQMLQLPPQTQSQQDTSIASKQELTIKKPIFPALDGVARKSKRAEQIDENTPDKFSCYRDTILFPVWFEVAPK